MMEFIAEHYLPIFNVSMNAASAFLLLIGFIAIKKNNKVLHQKMMLSALVVSSLFLVGYLLRVFYTGTHRFPVEGPIKTFYLSLLFVHTCMAIVCLPLIVRSFFLAFKERYAEHRKIAKITWPIWFFVSCSGVVVYYMLYSLAPRLVVVP